MMLYMSQGDVLLCGDLNARTSCENDFILHDSSKFIPMYSNYVSDRDILPRISQDKMLDNRGKNLIDFCISNQIRILNGRAFGDCFGRYTCFTPNGASTVDYVLASGHLLDQILYLHIADFDPTLSDCHCLLEWKISAKFKIINEVGNVSIHPVSPNFTWDEESAPKYLNALYCSDIQKKLDGVLKMEGSCQEQIIHATKEVENALRSAALLSLKRKKNPRPSKHRNKKWFDNDLHNKRKQLLNYGKIFSHYPRDPLVSGHFFKLRKEYSKLRKFKFKQYKRSLLEKLDSLHNDDPKLYWQIIDELRSRDSENDVSESVSPSSWLSHFKTLNTESASFKTRIKQLNDTLASLEVTPCFNELDFEISQSEVSKAIAKIGGNKAPGLDNISNHMIKHGQCVLIPILSKLFNACLTTGHYPAAWAGGAIRVIHKSGAYSDPNNYRGITITSAIGKLFNTVLNERFDKFLAKNNIIHESQIGFTKKARTSDHMFILKSILESHCSDRNGRVYACFVDFRKAFDTVIHTGIKIKLLQTGVGSKFYNIVKNMYNTSTSCIRLKNGVTDSFPVSVGVKQGDNLSPNLFKIFINDLPCYMQNTQDPVKLDDKDIHCLMFADDIVLFSKSPTGLQEKLNRLEDYCKDWCLSVNTSKTKIMIFNKAGKLIPHQFIYDGKPLECVKSYKYLGIHFCASGSFALAQSELYKKALKALFKLKRDFLCFGPSVKIFPPCV